MPIETSFDTSQFDPLEGLDVDTSQFNLGRIGGGAADMLKANTDSFFAAYAVPGSLAPSVSQSVFDEYMLHGFSETASKLVEEDWKSRTQTKHERLRARLNTDLGAFQDIVDESSRRMRASSLLEEMGIELNQEVTKRNLRQIAISNQLQQPLDDKHPEAIRIQDQMREGFDNYTLSDAELLGVGNTYRTSGFSSPEESQALSLLGSPVDDFNRHNAFNFVANMFLGGVLPGPYSYKTVKIMEELFPGLQSDPILNPAGAIEESRNQLLQMTPEERIAKAEQAKEVIQRWANLGYESNLGEDHDDDSLLQWDIYTTLFDDLSNKEMSASERALLNTAMRIADVLPVAGYLASMGRRVKFINDMAQGHRLMQSNRGLVRQLIKDIEEARAARGASGEVSEGERALQTRLEDLIEKGFPMPAGSGARVSHSILAPHDVTETPNLAVNYSSNNLTPTETEQFKLRELERTGRDILSSSYSLQLQNSSVSDISGGVVIDHAIGSTVDHGFSSPHYTGMVVDSLQDGERAIRITAKNPLTGETREVTRQDLDDMDALDNSPEAYRARRTPEEFTVHVSEPRPFSENAALAGEFEAARIGIRGRLAKYLNKSSLYQRYFTNASNAAEAQSDVVISTLRGIRETYTNLNPLSMRRANAAINKMDFEGRELSLHEILDVVDHDILAARGVLAVRKWADALHWNTNTNARRELVAWDGRAVTFDGGLNGRNTYIARKVRESVENPQDVIYNHADGTSRKYTAEEVERMVKQGFELYEFRRPIRIGKQQVARFWRKPYETNITIDKLPQVVVPKIPGYMPRIYDANFMVARIVHGTDRFGNPYTGREVVSLHHNVDQASRDLDARKSLNDSDEYTVLQTRELEDAGDDVLLSTAARNSVDYLEDSGKLFTTQRGRLLQPIGEHSFDGERGPLKDILETMEIAEYKVGNQAINDLVRLMTKRWEKDYVQDFGLENKYTGELQMPIWGELPRSRRDSRNDGAMRAAAIADRDHIQLIAGVDRTAVRKAWSNLVVNSSNALVSRFDPKSLWYKLGDSLLKVKDTDPLTGLRRINFVANIAWAPFRQLPLQAASATLYTSAPHALGYIAKGTASRDMIALTTYQLVKDLPGGSDEMKLWAKRLGMSEEEYRTLGEQFERTGFMQAIDSHAYAVGNYNGGVGQSIASTRALTGAGRGLRAFNDFARRIGFDVGEKTQRMFAFLIERNRYMQEGKSFSSETDFGQLVGDTMARTMNMTRTGSTALNRGAAGFFFQFMQWNIRTLQALLPRTLSFDKIPKGSWYDRHIGKLGDATFSTQEKLRIATYQTLFWGVGGWGFNNAYEGSLEFVSDKTGEVFEADPVVSEIVREGMIGETVNWALRSIMNDDSSVLVSSAFSPLAGFSGNLPSSDRLDSNPLVRIYEGLFLQNYDNLWDLAGPTSTTAKRFYNAFYYAYALMGLPTGIDSPTLPFDPEKSPDLAIDSMLRILPAYNNWAKGEAAWKIGRMVTDHGDLGTVATKGEAAIKALLGVQSADEKEVFEELTAFRGRVDKLQNSEYKDLQDTASTYYKNMKVLVTRLNAREISEEEFFKLASEHAGVMNYLADNELDRYRFWGFVSDKIRSDLNSNSDMELATLLSNAASSGDLPSIPSSITKINNMQSIDPEQKESIINFLNTNMELLRNGRLSTEQP